MIKKIFPLIISIIASIGVLSAQDYDFNCFSIVAGKNATVDGSVMVAHNEDDGGEQFLNIYRVPQIKHPKGSVTELRYGAKVPQPSQTNGYIWLELPDMDVSDGYLNDKGVVVVSDGCPSREDRDDFTEGGICYGVRRLTAERARSAREAVDIIGALVETYGYNSSGRSYVVADCNEAWIVSVAKGRKWAACRIPDDEVMIIPNYYVMNKVDLSDTVNYKGSSDVIDYAIERGWYDPKNDGEFNFSKVYSNPGSYVHPDNISREWSALIKLSGIDYKIEDYESFPFSFVPKNKVTLSDLMAILSDHYENTEIDAVEKGTNRNPHTIGGTICAGSTQYGAVYQLRSGMPVEIGAVMWLAPFRPCTQLFVPWYAGLQTIPERLSRNASYEEAYKNHFSGVKEYRKNFPNHRYWDYVDFAAEVEQDYVNNIKAITEKKALEQNILFKEQPKFEKKMLRLYNKDKDECLRKLTEYTNKWIR